MIDELEDAQLIAYLNGCNRLGWPPLTAEEFWPKYRQYMHCHRFLQAWWTYQAQPGNSPLQSVQRIVMGPTVSRMIRIRNQLGFIGTAVEAGKHEGGAGSAGVASKRPIRPVPRYTGN